MEIRSSHLCDYFLVSTSLFITGLDIGYVPAGPHAFFRSSGQFGPQQFILCWHAGPVAFQIGGKRMHQFFLLTCAAV